MIVVAQNGQRSKFSLLILGDSWDSCKVTPEGHHANPQGGFVLLHGGAGDGMDRQ
jgi:hypothetical protein